VEISLMLAALGASLAIGFGAIGSALGEGYIAMKAIQAIGKQPKASGKIVRIMVISQAITETAGIFALVVALIMLFKDQSNSIVVAVSYLSAGLAIGLSSLGSGFGSGLPGGSTMEGIGSNPENADALTANMIIGQAITQTSCIYGLTIALLLMLQEAPVSGNEFVTLFALLGAGLAIGLGGIGPGIGEGIVAQHANAGIARDPKNLGLLTRSMIIGQAITETTVIYSIVVSLILIFVV